MKLDNNFDFLIINLKSFIHFCLVYHSEYSYTPCDAMSYFNDIMAQQMAYDCNYNCIYVVRTNMLHTAKLGIKTSGNWEA